MGLKQIAIYFVLLLVNSLYASVSQISHTESKVLCASHFAQKTVSHFETEISDAYNSIRQLRITSDDVLEIQGRIAIGGAFASAILRVKTAQGTFAFKIYNEDTPLKELAPSIVIQNGFADRNLAPRIRGVMSSAHVAKLLQKFPEARKLIHDPEVSFGVLMDEVQITAQVTEKHISGTKPTMNKKTLEKRVREIETAFSEMRILIPEDLQLVFGRNDQLLLLDFDTYAYFNVDGVVITAFANHNTSVQDFAKASHRKEENLRHLQKKIYEVELLRLRKILGL